MEHIKLSKVFLEDTTLSIMVLDKEKRIIYANESLAKITGYKNDEIIGQDVSIFRVRMHSDEFYFNSWEQIDTKGIWEGEVWDRSKSGSRFLVRRFVFVYYDDEKKADYYVLISKDITSDREKENQFNDLLYKDHITGLPDKNVFKEILVRAINKSKRKGRKTAVVIAHLEQFKKINASFGYEVGDLILKKASQKLQKSAGDDAIITRMGSESFAFFLPEAPKENEMINTLEEVSDSFNNEPFVINQHEFYISLKMGVSVFPEDGKNHKELLRNADVALTKAKENHEDDYQFYTQELNVKVFEKLVMETNLRKAIDFDEFVLHYQPKINIEKNKIDSYEALIRWRHPEFGMVSPGRFIPLAEETGLIREIGDIVLVKACRDINRWREEGFENIKLAINISTIQLNNRNFPNKVSHILSKYNVDASAIEFEVTESTIMKDLEKTIEILKELTEIGVKISIDDFGTGYSSLSILTRLPLHALKIDRSFIKNVDKLENDSKVASLIIGLAKDLNLKVIAEGVETKGQLAFLKKQKCEFYQGYYYSPPVDFEQLRKFLELNNKK